MTTALAALSHILPVGISHVHLVGWALTRDRSEVACINGCLSVKLSSVGGVAANPRAKGAFVFVTGYRSMFLPGDRPIEHPWVVAFQSQVTPLRGGSLRRTYLLLPLWPVAAVLWLVWAMGYCGRGRRGDWAGHNPSLDRAG